MFRRCLNNLKSRKGIFWLVLIILLIAISVVSCNKSKEASLASAELEKIEEETVVITRSEWADLKMKADQVIQLQEEFNSLKDLVENTCPVCGGDKRIDGCEHSSKVCEICGGNLSKCKHAHKVKAAETTGKTASTKEPSNNSGTPAPAPAPVPVPTPAPTPVPTPDSNSITVSISPQSNTMYVNDVQTYDLYLNGNVASLNNFYEYVSVLPPKNTAYDNIRFDNVRFIDNNHVQFNVIAVTAVGLPDKKVNFCIKEGFAVGTNNQRSSASQNATVEILNRGGGSGGGGNHGGGGGNNGGGDDGDDGKNDAITPNVQLDGSITVKTGETKTIKGTVTSAKKINDGNFVSLSDSNVADIEVEVKDNSNFVIKVTGKTEGSTDLHIAEGFATSRTGHDSKASNAVTITVNKDGNTPEEKVIPDVKLAGSVTVKPEETKTIEGTVTSADKINSGDYITLSDSSVADIEVEVKDNSNFVIKVTGKTEGTTDLYVAEGFATSKTGHDSKRSNTVTVTVKAEAPKPEEKETPVVTLQLSSSQTEYKSGQTVSFKAVAWDRKGITSFDVTDKVVGIGDFLSDISITKVSALEYKISGTVIEDFVAAVEVSIEEGAAVNQDGNTSEASNAVKFKIVSDNVAPEVPVFPPLDNDDEAPVVYLDGGSTIYVGETIDLSVTAEDNSGIVKLSNITQSDINPLPEALKFVSFKRISDSEGIITLKAVTVGDGGIELVAGLAVDGAGNKSSASNECLITVEPNDEEDKIASDDVVFEKVENSSGANSSIITTPESSEGTLENETQTPEETNKPTEETQIPEETTEGTTESETQAPEVPESKPAEETQVPEETTNQTPESSSDDETLISPDEVVFEEETSEEKQSEETETKDSSQEIAAENVSGTEESTTEETTTTVEESAETVTETTTTVEEAAPATATSVEEASVDTQIAEVATASNAS